MEAAHVVNLLFFWMCFIWSGFGYASSGIMSGNYAKYRLKFVGNSYEFPIDRQVGSSREVRICYSPYVSLCGR